MKGTNRMRKDDVAQGMSHGSGQIVLAWGVGFGLRWEGERVHDARYAWWPMVALCIVTSCLAGTEKAPR